jgi:DNA glycosylase AlkZ-like
MTAIHDRVRARELFDFEYTLEMYKRAAKRRWGYFALPILRGDRLVGKVRCQSRPQGVRIAGECDPRGREAASSTTSARPKPTFATSRVHEAPLTPLLIPVQAFEPSAGIQRRPLAQPSRAGAITGAQNVQRQHSACK